MRWWKRWAAVSGTRSTKGCQLRFQTCVSCHVSGVCSQGTVYRFPGRVQVSHNIEDLSSSCPCCMQGHGVSYPGLGWGPGA